MTMGIGHPRHEHAESQCPIAKLRIAVFSITIAKPQVDKRT